MKNKIVSIITILVLLIAVVITIKMGKIVNCTPDSGQ